MKKTTYKQPTLKVVAFKSEQGFATSNSPLFSLDGIGAIYFNHGNREDDFEILDIDGEILQEGSFWVE